RDARVPGRIRLMLPGLLRDAPAGRARPPRGHGSESLRRGAARWAGRGSLPGFFFLEEIGVVDQAVAVEARELGQAVGLVFLGRENVAHLDAARDQAVGEHATVALPPQALGAEIAGAAIAGPGQQLGQRV